MAGNNKRLAMLQMVRESGRGGDRAGTRSAYPMDDPQRMGMMHYMPPYGSPGMSTDDDGRQMRRRHETRSGYDGDMPMDYRIGFGEQPMDRYDPEMRRRRRKDGTFMHHDDGEDRGMQPIRFGGMVSMERGRGIGHEKMTRELAEEWVGSMEGSDPAKPHGPKWSADQVKPIATKYGIPTEGERFWEFYAVMNAMYSDYYPVAKKYNTMTPEFFADMAMAFISDKDAVPNKTMMYYECIVK